MKTLRTFSTVIPALVASLLLTVPPAGGQTVILKDGNSSATVQVDGQAGMNQWKVEGTNLAANAAAAARPNTAIVPVSRTGAGTNRQALVLKRAKDNPGECDIAFIGDSITQGWEGPGRKVWDKYYGARKALNFGVGGDRTQHVLWRFENGQLDGVKPKAAVLMIGTNNSNNQDNSEAEILEGVTAIVNQIRRRLPETKLIVFGIFPRAKTFSPQRGKILQINQALAKLADDKLVFYIDIGPQLIEADGSISTDMMRDALHPGERGYEIWAAAMEPKLKEVLAN